MNKLKYNLNLKFLNTIDTEEKNNLLIQTLIILYDMNHNNMIYMNDIYTERGLRNIMVTNVKHNIKNIEYIFDTYNTKLIIPINKYKIKIIDYGWINKYPEFRTTEYMEKYFNNLYKNKIISEVILFTYFYFINCNLNKTYILPLINKFISDIYTTDVKKLDYLFITNLIKYMQSHPNFYIYNIQ